MLKKRIIPCLDVKAGQVVKGIQFRQHEVVGDILDLAMRYEREGADELVFYDITASSDERAVSTFWVNEIARYLSIPFCVAGGIRNLEIAERILAAGADKISINSPALEDPNLINKLANRFGTQCIVVGIDSLFQEDYFVCQYTGDEKKTRVTQRRTLDWVQEVEQRGAGEIVLNAMNQDGMRQGYDVQQLALIGDKINIPMVASGGAGMIEHFSEVFKRTRATGALAASVFHKNMIGLSELKQYLRAKDIEVRLC
ncbi:MAG: imidazole glycerol phosphate synthase subunit HisF [Gammaproteobacteria bacterium]